MAEVELSMIESKKYEKSKQTNSKDIIFSVIGDFGKWQLAISVLMGLLKIPIAWFQLEIVFLAPVPRFSCKKPSMMMNYSDEEWNIIAKPANQTTSCFIYDPEILLSRVVNNDTKIPPILPCREFSYDRSIFSSTIITEWDLVCTKTNYVEIAQVSLMFGVLVGNVLFGFLADRYGRKKPLIFTIFLQAVASYMTAVVPWFSVFIITRIILGIANGGLAIISFVMCMESVGGRWRTIIPILYQLPFGVGNSIMAALSFWLRDWRHLQYSLSSLSSLYLIYYWLVPESPRWLIATGQKEKAICILEKVAITNSSDPTVAEKLIRDDVPYKAAKKVEFRVFFKLKNLRMKTIILIIEWFGSGICFFAFSQYMGHIGNNLFVTVTIAGLLVIPGVILCIPIVQHFGRKLTIMLFESMTVLCFLGIIAFPKGSYPGDWPRILFAGLGIFSLSIFLPVLHLYTGELFPTVIRNASFGVMVMFSRLGSMLAPFIVGLEGYFSSLPLIVLCLITTFLVALLYPLPETKGCPLLDSIDEAEHFDKKAAFLIRNNNNAT